MSTSWCLSAEEEKQFLPFPPNTIPSQQQAVFFLCYLLYINTDIFVYYQTFCDFYIRIFQNSLHSGAPCVRCNHAIVTSMSSLFNRALNVQKKIRILWTYAKEFSLFRSPYSLVLKSN